MYCPYCGKKIANPDTFCPQCGKLLPEDKIPPQPKPEFVFPKSDAPAGRWTAETDIGEIEPFSMPVCSLIMERIADGRTQFLILTPPGLIENCRFIQFCSDDQGKLHAEIAMAKGLEGTVIRAADQIGIRDAVLMCEKFLNGRRPSFPEGRHRRIY